MCQLLPLYPFNYLIHWISFDLALVVTRRRRPGPKAAKGRAGQRDVMLAASTKNELLGDSCWPAYGLSHTDDPLRHCPMHYATLLFFSFFLKVHIQPTSKEDQRQLLPVVKHLRTDGPQPIVLTSGSDADSQRLAAGGRPGADGSE